jgi:hypothetical protein
MWNESIEHEVITWTKWNCHSQGWKTEICNDIIMDVIYRSSFEENQSDAHRKIGISVTTKEYICTKCNPTKKFGQKG